MNIISLENIKYDVVSKTYNIQDPSFYNNLRIELYEYEVQLGETMRPDLIMKSMYRDDIDIFDNWDVILYINGIENPLNVKQGMFLLYPNKSELDEFRYNIRGGDLSNGDETTAEEISKVDKSTRKDKKREKFVKGNYKLPPVVTDKPKPSVRVVGGDITIGGF
mgnify:CR=1 FL=1